MKRSEGGLESLEIGSKASKVVPVLVGAFSVRKLTLCSSNKTLSSFLSKVHLFGGYPYYTTNKVYFTKKFHFEEKPFRIWFFSNSKKDKTDYKQNIDLYYVKNTPVLTSEQITTKKSRNTKA